MPLLSVSGSQALALRPSMTASGITSIRGTSAKARSVSRGCGICSPGSSIATSPKSRMSMSIRRGPQRSMRSRPSSPLDAEDRFEQSARRERRVDPDRRIQERRLVDLAPGRRQVERRDGFDLDLRIGGEPIDRGRDQFAAVADIAAETEHGGSHRGVPPAPLPAASIAAVISQRLDMLGDVVDAHDSGAAECRDDICHERADESVGIVASRHLADERFSRGADKDRIAERGQLAEAAEELQVLLRRLAEAESRIEHDPVVMDAGLMGDFERALEICEARLDRVAGERLRRAEQAGIVHGDDAGAVPGGDLGHLRVALQPANIVDDFSPAQHRGFGDRRLHRVDGDQARRPAASASMTGRTRRFSCSAGTAAASLRVEFPADVEDGRALSGEAPSLRDGRILVLEQPAVIERIRASR